MLYCVRENHYPHAYHSFYLFIYSFSPIKFAVKDFAETTVPRILKFCTNIGYDLYCVRETQHPHVCHSHYLSIFLFLQIKFLSQFSQRLWEPDSSNVVYN